jgi:hypothetical protein
MIALGVVVIALSASYYLIKKQGLGRNLFGDCPLRSLFPPYAIFFILQGAPDTSAIQDLGQVLMGLNALEW